MKWEVLPNESGIKLQAFLKLKLGDRFSSRQLKQMIEHNQCQINNRIERFASAFVGTGDIISFSYDEHPLEAKPTPLKFDPKRILYEDSDLLIYDKPSGISSDNPDFLRIIKRKLPFLTLVHRLDKETTGILIFAKSEEAKLSMMELFKNRLINKTYLALVDKVPCPSTGIIENYLGELHRYEGQVIWGSVPKGKGLSAITEWKCEKHGNSAALMRCFPKTGRTHQIRVHMSEMGHPLLGDFHYGKQFHCKYRPSRCMLHALEIRFIHPRSSKEVIVISSLPADMAEAISKLFEAS